MVYLEFLYCPVFVFKQPLLPVCMIWSDKILFQPEPYRTAAATLLWQAAHQAPVKYAPLNLNTAFLCYIFFLTCYNVLVETSISR